MDNALIDDRRIHVDFSQSVSKLWNQFRRKGNQGNNPLSGLYMRMLLHIASNYRYLIPCYVHLKIFILDYYQVANLFTGTINQ